MNRLKINYNLIVTKFSAHLNMGNGPFKFEVGLGFVNMVKREILASDRCEWPLINL